MTFEEMMRRVLATIEERKADYGDPDVMFNEIALRWSIGSEDVALRMADMKMARMTTGRFTQDGVIDAIAYLLLAWRFHDQETAKAE
jgi:hypothetical protein